MSVLLAGLLTAQNTFAGECEAQGLARYRAHRDEYRSTQGAFLRSWRKYQVTAHDEVYTDEGALRARLYVPRSGSRAVRPRGVIVQIHGGGWVMGSRTDIPDMARHLAQGGWLVVSPDYRLAPAHRFPAQLEDLDRLVEWIDQNAERLGLPEKPALRIWGFSAGAHLAAHQLMRSHVQRIAAVVLLSARTDLTAARGNDSSSSAYLGVSFEENPDAYVAASPLHLLPAPGAEPQALPPTLHVHQLRDHVIPYEQSCRFWERLRRLGADSRVMLIPGTRPSHGPVGEDRQVFIQAMSRFFDL